MRGQLYINNILVDLEDDVPFPLSFAITDISDLSKRRGNKSKTITLPGTAKNQQLFFGIFSVTAQDVNVINFDPTIKAVARYFNGSLLQFNGVCQLNRCIKSNNVWSFEINLYGEVIDFNKNMSAIKLNELDFSEYNHELSQTNIVSSWNSVKVLNGTPTILATKGYYYGLVNYGYNPATPDTFAINEIPPQVFVNEVMTKLATASGFNIDSDFFKTTFFKSLLLAYSGGELPQLSSAQADDESVKSDDLFAVANVVQGVSITGTQMRFHEDVKAQPFAVTVTQDTTTQTISSNPYRIRSKTQGLFEFQYIGTHDIEIDVDKKGKSFQAILDFDYLIEVSVNGAIQYADIVYSDTVLTTTLTTNFSYTDSISFSYIKALNLQVGDIVSVKFRTRIRSNDFVKSIFPQNVIPTLNYNFTANTATANIIKLPQDITEGSIVNLSSFIPDLNGAEFFKGIVTMFNLMVKVNESDPTLIEIEPFDDFFNGVENWTEYLDTSQPIEVTPTINFAPKDFQFKFKHDNTRWLNQYLTDTGKYYGDRIVNSNSQLAKDSTILELPFSCPPLVNLVGSTLTIPNVTTLDGTTDKPIKGSPFIAQLTGFKSANWTLKTTAFTGYPMIGHASSSFDLTFVKPDKVFYTATSYPDDNLFNYHENSIAELLSKFGKMVKAKFRLNSDVINRLSLRRFVIVEKTKYRINLIENYDAISYETCDVELIKSNGNN